MASRALSSAFPRYPKTLLSRLRVEIQVVRRSSTSRSRVGKRKKEEMQVRKLSKQCRLDQLPVAVSS